MRIFIGAVVFCYSALSWAANMPSYAGGGDIASDLESKGQAITELIVLVGMIVGIMGLAWGGVKFGSGNAQEGKTWIVNSLIGMVICGSIYGIAAVAVN